MHVVVRELELKVVLSAELKVPVPARLTYRTDDPYAVHLTFHIGTENLLTWAFSRELLIEGLLQPCGDGDVRIWPSRADGRRVVLIALSTPDGDALLETSATVVSIWLERTLLAVPAGTEYAGLNLDLSLAELLAPRPTDGLWARGQSPAGGKEAPKPSDDSPDGDG
ncbi:SsgA family sporulation/cell division regulator [Streptomyces albipurpureus]|uniref:SsgA family sporulation/cell division regulator n=1 Tax=Streptomyces albipurpureus TaxID=2897419 RepID=A0ABT0UJ00_9ACTN|nr:SsgA family sporulation/cell division regulator [Streptomyces sp. CWNU-1]MCM2387281.1 SsgA family sporulation/cell division regulator [Streptomyces sp. CWNU-1]